MKKPSASQEENPYTNLTMLAPGNFGLDTIFRFIILSHSRKHIKGSKQEWYYYRSHVESPLSHTYTEI